MVARGRPGGNVIRTCSSPLRRGTVLLNERDAVAAAGHVDPVAIGFDITGVLDRNLPPPQPPLALPVAHEHVVADDRVVADLVLDAAGRVMHDDIVLVE